VASLALRLASAYALTAAVALALVGLSFNNGSFEVTTRNAVAVALWWALMLGVALGDWPRDRVPRTALAAGLALVGLALLTGLSVSWSDSAERAFDEFARVLLYLGVFALAIVATRRGDASRWADGVALGITAIALLALVARLFPSFIEASVPKGAFEGDVRPTYPLGYWNAVAVFAALALPLLLRTATSSAWALVRSLALAAVPALVALIYLTSSRTGVATGVVALVCFVALTSDRLRALLAIAVAGVGAAGAVAVLSANSAILDGPLDTGSAHYEGRVCAFAILGIALAVGVVHAVSSRLELRLPPLSRPLKRGALALAAVIVVGALVAAEPAERFESFKEPPAERGTGYGTSYIQDHLTSGGSNGRWQFWSAAVDQWEEHSVVGDGAGSYAAWWAEHGTLAYVTRDAHSLYAETLGELGLVGLLLLLGLLGALGVAVWDRTRRTPATDRSTSAALAACAAAFAFAAGIDWMWENPVVTITGMLAFGLLAGPATAPSAPSAMPVSTGRGRIARAAAVAAAIAVIVAEGIPLLAQTELDESNERAARGDVEGALQSANDAREWQPWAASPYLQIALAHEAAGRYDSAQAAIDDAIERDASDWRLRLVASRVDIAAGDESDGRREFGEALRLNPRSALLASLERQILGASSDRP
jgi:hypothetical protein